MIIFRRVNGKFAYMLTSKLVRSRDFGHIRVYGISILSLRDGRRRADVENMSDDYRKVYDLFRWIVVNDLYPECLMEVVEDYIAGRFPKAAYLSRFFDPTIA